MSTKEKAATQDPSSLEEPDRARGHASERFAAGDDGVRLFPQPICGDRLDPLNWSPWQKHAVLAIIMALYFMFTYITTTTVPSFPELQERYDVTLSEINWSVAIPALGLSVGPLIWSGPADIIGRRPIMILGTTIAFAATVWAAVAGDYSGYMAARFFQGFGVSPAANVGLAIINDTSFEHERGQKIGLWVLAIDLGLLFGPLIGGFVDLAGDAWIQWLTAIMIGVILVAELAFLPETLYPRGLMLSESTSTTFSPPLQEKVMSTHTNSTVKRTTQLPLWNVMPVPGVRRPGLLEPYVHFVMTFKMLVVMISIMTYCFGWYWWVLSVVTMLPVAYANYSPQIQGLLYLGLIIGTLISEVFLSGRLSDWLMNKRAKEGSGNRRPEIRLWLAYPAAILTAIGLIVWGVSVDNGYHWAVGQVALALFGAGIQMGNTAICSYVVDSYPMQSMAVMTFYAVMLNLSAFIDPFFIVTWVENVGFTWTFSAHALITVGFCIPVVGLLQRYGQSLRERSGTPSWVNPEFSEAQSSST